MNARRRPRLFLDHKPPLVAFTVVAIACALMMVHMARSEATPGGCVRAWAASSASR